MIHPDLRKQILERDNKTCQRCGIMSEIGLHLHHIISRKDGGTDSLENLVTLCPSCHIILEPRRIELEFNSKNYPDEFTVQQCGNSAHIRLSNKWVGKRIRVHIEEIQE